MSTKAVKRRNMVSVYPIRRVDKNWEHLVIKRVNKSYNWQCVTGGVEIDEKPIECAYRELFEETGYKTDQLIPYPTPPDYFVDDEDEGEIDEELYQFILKNFDNIVFIAIIKDEKNPVLNPQEHTDWAWCDFETAYNKVMWAIEKKQHRLIHQFILESNLFS